MIEEAYKNFLARKLERNLYEDVISRLSKQDRAKIYEIIISLACVDPEKDEEFMERVGNQVVKRSERVVTQDI